MSMARPSTVALLTSDRMELIFIVLFMYLRKIREEKLKKVVDTTAAKAKTSLPVTSK